MLESETYRGLRVYFQTYSDGVKANVLGRYEPSVGKVIARNKETAFNQMKILIDKFWKERYGEQ